MGHTSEEQWYARREKLRKGVSQYYKAKKIARLLAVNLALIARRTSTLGSTIAAA
jgi:hypothetical protein